jgi:insertion element IS1 protein InsB
MPMQCQYCKEICIRKGFAKTVQRYQCKVCKRYQQKRYSNHRFTDYDRLVIINHIRNACGIRDMARLLKRAPSSLVMVIKRYAKLLQNPILEERRQTYEMDEMTVKMAKQKDVYLAYALNKKTGKIVAFNIGGRTKEIIGSVTKFVLALSPKRVYTDGLNLYPNLIGKNIHRGNKYYTVHIERKNGTLRTHLKRLSKSGLCFSRSMEMLNAIVKLYLWGNSSAN